MVSAVLTHTFNNSFDPHWKTVTNGDDVRRLSLPFGSYNDPLRALTLSAIFPISPSDEYHENIVDALTAKHWRLAAELAPVNQQRAYFSSLLDQIVSSWIKDPGNRDYLSPYDAANFSLAEGNNSDSSLMRNLFFSSSVQQQQQADVVEQILYTVFDTKEDDSFSYATNIPHERRRPYYTTSDLGLRIMHGASVPVGSLLWDYLYHALQAMFSSQETKKGGQVTVASPMGFFKAIWIEIVRRIRWHWENSVPIPKVDTCPKEEEEEHGSNATLNSANGIDLRYNIASKKRKFILFQL